MFALPHYPLSSEKYLNKFKEYFNELIPKPEQNVSTGNKYIPKLQLWDKVL